MGIVMSDIKGKLASFTLDDAETLAEICHALSSPVRLDVLRLIAKKSKSVGEIAQELDIPMSTAALAVQVLKKAGVITTENQPGMRGTLKLCSRRLDRIVVNLAPPDDVPEQSVTFSMPIGGYSMAEGIQPTCGLASANSFIGLMDVPASFYLPERFSAQLIWLQQGFLEYRFSAIDPNFTEIDWLEISFEACSEKAVDYHIAVFYEVCVVVSFINYALVEHIQIIQRNLIRRPSAGEQDQRIAAQFGETAGDDKTVSAVFPFATDNQDVSFILAEILVNNPGGFSAGSFHKTGKGRASLNRLRLGGEHFFACYQIHLIT